MNTATMNTGTTNRGTTRRRRRWVAGAASLVAVLAVAGCGGSSGAEDSATADTAGGAEQSSGDISAYQDCLADNGLQAGGEQPDADAFAAAQEACADLAPAGGSGSPGGLGASGGGPGGAEMQEYLACLQENGLEVDLPERPAGAEGEAPSGEPPSGEAPTGEPPAGGPPAGGGGPFADLDESDPAVAACAELKPEMPEMPDGGEMQRGGGAPDTSSGSSDDSASAAEQS